MVVAATMVVALLMLLLMPLTAVRPPKPPPPIPAGVVTPQEPVVAASGAVTIPATTFTQVADPRSIGTLPAPVAGTPSRPVYIGVDGQRITVERISRFLTPRQSPMAPFAENIVVAGLKYGVDPRLIVAISGTESTYGKFHRGHNAWGWDAPNGLTRWASWPEAIDQYTKLFASKYRERDPSQIGPRYCPDCVEWPDRTRRVFALI
ncbi:MAG TPA: hypothetical protein VNE62_00025 [Actinomycetota bacterium]|nr:hypothetical protein [Actinomycetota bacterium]